MLDLTTILIAVGVFFGLIIGDAAYFGDPMSVQISIPPKLAERGFTRAAAEELFATEATRISLNTSIVPTPNLELSTRPGLADTIATPLQLESFVVALQSRIGLDVTTIHGTILADDKTPSLSMLMVITPPGEPPAEISLAREDGDARALIHQATRLALEWVAPYRVALADFVDGLDGDPAGFQRAQETTARAVGRPWYPRRATERVMLFNLVALMALVRGDAAGAEVQFRIADAIPEALPGAYGTISINRTFLAIAAKRPDDARRWFEKSRKQTAAVQLPGWPTEMAMLEALVAWSEGNTAHAEALLREAVAATPGYQGPHVYLAQLLAARGDLAGAAEQQAAAPTRLRFNPRIPSLAQSEFWVDPVNGGVTRRQ